MEWILNQNQVILAWKPDLGYIEDEEEWQRAMACCRLVLQAGIRIDLLGNRLPENPSYREQFCALLQEFGQQPVSH